MHNPANHSYLISTVLKSSRSMPEKISTTSFNNTVTIREKAIKFLIPDQISDTFLVKIEKEMYDQFQPKYGLNNGIILAGVHHIIWVRSCEIR